MSKDFQLAWTCPHLTLEEVASLDSDRMSLLTRQPIGNENTVRILANDDLLIPQSGLFSVAQLSSTVSGPFDVNPEKNTLQVTASTGTQTFVFPVRTLTRYTTEEAIKFLQKNRLQTAAAENVNGHLVFSDPYAIGPDSFVRVSGSAAPTFGFGDPSQNDFRPYADRGKQVYPGWRLHRRPDTLTNKYPRFASPVKLNPIIKVSYSTIGARCLRCQGTFIENDYRFDTSGQAILIENENLLYQACLKTILTDRGSNPYFPWYGTTIRSRIGAKALGAMASLISEDVRRALSKLKELQNSQSQYQQVTTKEKIYSILSVQTKQHVQDPTAFLVDVVVQNASAEPVSLAIVFAVPTVVALMGSNGLFLGQNALAAGQVGQIQVPLLPTR